MKDLFVPYKTALLAEQKGFTNRCLACINPQGQIEIGNTSYLMIWMQKNKTDIFAPLYQQIVDWLRETHNIAIVVKKDWSNGKFMGWEWVLDIEDGFHNGSTHKTYMEALTEAIEEAFKLI